LRLSPLTGFSSAVHDLVGGFFELPDPSRTGRLLAREEVVHLQRLKTQPSLHARGLNAHTLSADILDTHKSTGESRMLTKFSALVLAVLLAVSAVVLPGSSVAFGAAGGTGPADALTPAGEWKPLAVGQQDWYAFNYDGGDTDVLVRMGVSPNGSAGFSVWTPENVRQWVAGEKPTPIGRGAKGDLYGDDLVWTGSFKFPGTYYVVVEQTGQAPGFYALNVSGKGVSFPPAKAEAAAVAAPAAAKAAPQAKQAAAPVAAAAVAKAGAGPDDALAPTGEWAALAKGQQVWYALPQDGGASKILVRMAVDPKNAAGFKILTPEQVRLWAAGQTYDPVGRGAASAAFGDDLVWTGSFKTPGTHYIVVEQTGPNAGGYKLSVQ
jgi:hypothetical protein